MKMQKVFTYFCFGIAGYGTTKSLAKLDAEEHLRKFMRDIPVVHEACRKAVAFVIDGQLVAHKSFGELLNRQQSADLLRQAITITEKAA